MDSKSNMRRPPSYSDSLLYIPELSQAPLVPYKPLQLQEPLLSPSEPKPSRTFTPAETWYNRLVGFAFHITLISIFETVFFFQFISRSEDTGLQKTISGYIEGILTSCNGWSPNTTLFVNDVLSDLINTTTVQQDYQQAVLIRHSENNALQVQAWLYVIGLTSITAVAVSLGYQASLRLAWKRILLDNALMVTLLGLYEFLFFKTIIYNYQNLSLPELNEYVISQLQQTCGLLSP
jgi:hypothetical protein